MRALLAVAMVALLPSVAACLQVAGTGVDDAAVDVRALAEGTRSTVTEPEVLVATNEEEWRAIWSLTGRSDPRPDVDFSRERVLAAFAGMKPTGGWSVAVTDVHRDAGGELKVVVATTSPHPESLTTQALVHPYAMVTVPADGELVVEAREQVAPPPNNT